MGFIPYPVIFMFHAPVPQRHTVQKISLPLCLFLHLLLPSRGKMLDVLTSVE